MTVQKNSAEASSSKDTLMYIFMPFIIILTVLLFSLWGYTLVIHWLNLLFGIPSGTTVYTSIVGIIAIVASGFTFAGAVLLLKLRASNVKFLRLGSSMFMVKNLFDILDTFFKTKFAIAQVGSNPSALVESAASAMGYDVFQLAFWLFVFLYFTNETYQRSVKVK